MLATLAMLSDDKSGVVRRAVVRGAACMARSLLEKDEEIQDALREADADDGAAESSSPVEAQKDGGESEEEEEEEEEDQDNDDADGPMTDAKQQGDGDADAGASDAATLAEDHKTEGGGDTATPADAQGVEGITPADAARPASKTVSAPAPLRRQYRGMTTAEARAEQQAISRQF